MPRGERGGVGGLVALVTAAAVVGAVAGWLLAAREPATTEHGRAVPLVASPAVPGDPEPSYAPDSDALPPLPTELDFTTREIGAGENAWTYDVPVDWEPVEVDAGQRWIPPGLEEFTYRMRVVSISGFTSTTAQAAANRRDLVRSLRGYEEVALTDDALVFTYVTLENRLRYQHTRFLAVPGSDRAGFEITVAGRRRDVPGLEALMAHLVETSRRTQG